MVDKKDFAYFESAWELQQSGIYFLGKEVRFSIDIKIDSEDPAREIFDEQIETLHIIYPKWEELAATIEQEILAYEKKSKEKLLQVLDSPHIWLAMDCDTNQPRKNNHWTFVLGVSENEDFGWHVEFEGDIHIDTWAGG